MSSMQIRRAHCSSLQIQATADQKKFLILKVLPLFSPYPPALPSESHCMWLKALTHLNHCTQQHCAPSSSTLPADSFSMKAMLIWSRGNPPLLPHCVLQRHSVVPSSPESFWYLPTWEQPSNPSLRQAPSGLKARNLQIQYCGLGCSGHC